MHRPMQRRMQRRIRKPRPSDGTVLLGVLSMIFSLGTAAVVVVKARPLPPVLVPITAQGAGTSPEPSTRLAAEAPGPLPSTAAMEAELQRQLDQPEISFGSYEGY